MNRKNRNIIVAVIIIIVLVFVIVYSNFKNALVRQLRGPTEGTGGVITFDGKLAVVSNSNYIYTWQWSDLSIWPLVAKLQAQTAMPLTGDKIVYVPSNNGELILTDLKADKKLASLSFPYEAEGKKIRTSSNGRLGLISVLFKEGAKKGWFKLGLFDSELKSLSFVFQKDTDAEDFLLYDFTITNDGNLLAGAGEKGQAWIFVIDVNNGNVLWEKTFNEYGRFTSVRFSPDGRTLFVSEKIRHIIALDSATGKTIRVFEMPLYSARGYQKQNISSIAISPNGRVLAADSEPAGTVWFWDIKTGREIASFHVGDLTISSITFSPDSKYLATGCMVSPEIKIWKVPQLKP